MRIYVGNVAYAATEDELSHLFEGYGVVRRVQIMTDRETGRSRGFAYVDMPNDLEAQAAMAGLNGRVLGGRPLTVSAAHPREGDDGRRRPRE
jgi:cold-inducible RNA-binding protein